MMLPLLKSFVGNSLGTVFRIGLWKRKGYQYFPAFLATPLLLLFEQQKMWDGDYHPALFTSYVWSTLKSWGWCKNMLLVLSTIKKAVFMDILLPKVAAWKYKFWCSLKKKSVSLLYYHASHFDFWISYYQWVLITNLWEKINLKYKLVDLAT